jgi:hypothetical protein
MEDLLDEAGVKAEAVVAGPRCPSCKAPLKPNAVLCVECGLQLETGKQLKGASAVRGEDVAAAFGLSGEEGHGAAAKSLLVKAQKTIATDKHEEYKIRTQGMPTWALVVSLGSLVTFGVSMSLLPARTALYITGGVLMLLPGVVALICNIMILVVAFSESVKQGLCCLFIPFYSIYFAATHWEACGRYLIIALICGSLSGTGGILARFMTDIGGGVAGDSAVGKPIDPSKLVVISAKRSVRYAGLSAAQMEKGICLVVRVHGTVGADVSLMGGKEPYKPRKTYTSPDNSFTELGFVVLRDTLGFELVDGSRRVSFNAAPAIKDEIMVAE